MAAESTGGARVAAGGSRWQSIHARRSKRSHSQSQLYEVKHCNRTGRHTAVVKNSRYLTLKSRPARKMIALMLLYLLTMTVIAKNSENSLASSLININRIHQSYDEIAPYKLNNHNFAVADLDKKLSMKNVDFKSNSITTGNCVIPFKQAPMIPMRRLGRKIVLFAADANHKVDRQQTMKLVLVNTTNCTYALAYNGTLHETNWIFVNNNKSLNESFSIIQHGKKFCGGHNWCRLFFNPFYQKSEPLDFDFPQHWLFGIRPIMSFDGDIFALELVDNTATYRALLHNITDNSVAELFRLERFFINGWMSRYEVRSSSLSYCWRTSEGAYEDKTIHCASFRQDGTELFNETIVYPDFMRLLNVKSIPNGLILISTSPDMCFRRICLPVQATVFTMDFKSLNNSISVLHSTLTSRGNDWMEINHPEYHFECRPRRVNVSDDASEIDYIYCKYRHEAHIITYLI